MRFGRYGKKGWIDWLMKSINVQSQRVYTSKMYACKYTHMLTCSLVYVKDSIMGSVMHI